jgi:predicted DNA-binding transcriptional regulator AlpA
MPPIPPDQRSQYGTAPTRSNSPAESGNDGNDAKRREAKLVARRTKLAQSGFPIFVRFDDLVAAGLVGSWTQLLRMIDDEDFPPGTLLSANVRAWLSTEVETWLTSRPSARKAVPPDAVHPRVRDKRRAAEEAQP